MNGNGLYEKWWKHGNAKNKNKLVELKASVDKNDL